MNQQATEQTKQKVSQPGDNPRRFRGRQGQGTLEPLAREKRTPEARLGRKVPLLDFGAQRGTPRRTTRRREEPETREVRTIANGGRTAQHPNSSLSWEFARTLREPTRRHRELTQRSAVAPSGQSLPMGPGGGNFGHAQWHKTGKTGLRQDPTKRAAQRSYQGHTIGHLGTFWGDPRHAWNHGQICVTARGGTQRTPPRGRPPRGHPTGRTAPQRTEPGNQRGGRVDTTGVAQGDTCGPEGSDEPPKRRRPAECTPACRGAGAPLSINERAPTHIWRGPQKGGNSPTRG